MICGELLPRPPNIFVFVLSPSQPIISGLAKIWTLTNTICPHLKKNADKTLCWCQRRHLGGSKTQLQLSRSVRRILTYPQRRETQHEQKHFLPFYPILGLYHILIAKKSHLWSTDLVLATLDRSGDLIITSAIALIGFLKPKHTYCCYLTTPPT